MSKKTIQYASQLFLSFESAATRTPPLIPFAKTLILAGNNFRHSSPNNRDWLKYLSTSWDDVCIIPGLLEHSWLGLQEQTDIDESETRLKEELAPYPNIHYLNRNSVNVKDDICVSGLIKWPSYIEHLHADPASKAIHHSHIMHTKLWKEEENEWVRDTINRFTSPHIMASYLCPLPHMVGSHYCNPPPTQVEPSFYSLYYALYKYPQPLQAWIFGIPKANITGYCPNKHTFLGCNSQDGPGYSPQMIMCI